MSDPRTKGMAIKNNPLLADLDYVLAMTADFWEDLRGGQIFITGGTGFFGSWLLESFLWANHKLCLNAKALILTRNPDAFRKSEPNLTADNAISFHVGDIRNFIFPEGKFSHIIHAATTSASATFYGEDQLVKFDTIVEGTRHILDFAVQCNAEKFLMTSSGSVYGKQPADMFHISEDYCGAPDSLDVNSALGTGKRAAEFLCSYYSSKYGIDTKIARCFSFVGPYLPLDIHYAIGNFIRDGLNGGPIRIHGDGTPYRSYLYAADLTTWLWTILFKGESCYPYNVGSENAVNISDLAIAVADCFHKQIDVIIAKSPEPGKPHERYVPSTKRASALGVRQMVSLREAIERTILWQSREAYSRGNE